jgi:hypothetical protein
MFKSRRKKQLEKMKDYANDWDTERHGYVLVMADGRLIPTNSKGSTITVGGFRLNKKEFFDLVTLIQCPA